MKRLAILLTSLFILFPLSAYETDGNVNVRLSDNMIRLINESIEKQDTQEEEISWWQREIEKADISYDLYLRMPVTYNTTTIGIGGGFNIGVKTASFKFELYTLGDYFLSPHGSNGGVQSLDFMIEPGMMFAWKILEVWRTRTYIALDIGYFMQFASLPWYPEEIFLAENGVMLRPKVMTEIVIGKHYDMSIGIFYQFPIYPDYSGYRGFGVMFAVL